ncbi:putative GNAT family acetyltransferase [Pseudomonas sp. W3I7]|uniref:M12 family metallopeptidase n=1 Tax=Pseudomonas sp. W3I7 TaxID=3042292 RepID=UPI00279270EA|nr:M12 family metallopeptidase [Pseudomonas sp. W3I7]MDQ0705669.1 putative GNAT family acetyltransferase [Pseudomonas sp. W3I7]
MTNLSTATLGFTPTRTHDSDIYQAPPDKSHSRKTRAVSAPDKYWPQNSTLKIAVYDADEEALEHIKKAANLWLVHINLTFEFVPGEEGDIRIALDYGETHSGSSAIGTDAQKVPLYLPTMVLPNPYDNPRFEAVAAHEFGHALGLHHEHKHPNRTIDFNTPVIYRHFRGHGSNEAIYKDILQPLDEKNVAASEYDNKSIMHYGFSSDALWKQPAIPWPTRLTKLDKSHIASQYPKP